MSRLNQQTKIQHRFQVYVILCPLMPNELAFRTPLCMCIVISFSIHKKTTTEEQPVYSLTDMWLTN